MTVTREAVFKALFAIVATVKWSNAEVVPPYVDRKFIMTGRRIKLFNAVPASQQPACFQGEHNENIAQVTGMPYKQIWNAQWVVYQNTGSSPTAEPTIENNKILDAVFEAFKPKPTAGVSWDPKDPRQTLGGLVYHCYIEGELFKDPGDIDNQGMMVIPIKILIPN